MFHEKKCFMKKMFITNYENIILILIAFLLSLEFINEPGTVVDSCFGQSLNLLAS